MNTAVQAQRLPELASQLLTRAPAIVLVLVTIAVFTRAALLIADLAGSSSATAPSTASSAPAAARKVVDVASILRAQLFGLSAAPTGTDAPVTTMNLVLKLVFALNDEKRGLAALGPSATDIKVYQVGDAVPGGASLHAVYVDRVLLDRGGKIEALMMQPREGMQAAAPPPMPVNAAASVERVQQAVRNNPGLINQIMSRQPVFKNSRLSGIRVNPGPNAQAFARLGLKPNDIVKAINGAPLDDQDRSNEIFNNLSSAPQARVTIERGDREMELTLNLAEVANEAERINDAPPPPGEPDPDSTR